MDPISTLNQAMAALREQMTERARRGERTPSSTNGKALREANALPAARESHSDVKTLIRDRIAALRGLGIEDETQLSRAAIELWLRHEFGFALTNDAQFQQMATWVHQGLAEDEESQAALQAWLRG